MPADPKSAKKTVKSFCTFAKAARKMLAKSAKGDGDALKGRSLEGG